MTSPGPLRKPAAPRVRVTAIVVNWNGRRWLPGTLATLHAQTGVSFDIVIVDNGSTDDSVNYIRASAPEVILVRSEVNTGFAGGMNLGLAHSTGEYVLALNPDVDLDPAYLSTLLGEMEVRPDVAAASGVLLRSPGSDGKPVVDSLGHRMLAGYWPENVGHGRQMSWPQRAPWEVFGVCAAAGLYWRRALEDVRLPSGIFCTTFFAYLEDVDLDVRLRARGWSAIVVPGAVAHHQRSGTGARDRAFVRRHIVKNSLLLPIRTIPAAWLSRDLAVMLAIRLGVVIQYSIASPSAILGVADACRALRGSLRERRMIKESTVVQWSTQRHWVEPFPWRVKVPRFLHKVLQRAV